MSDPIQRQTYSSWVNAPKRAEHTAFALIILCYTRQFLPTGCVNLFFSLKVAGRGLSPPPLSLSVPLSDTSTLHRSVSLSLSLSVPLYLSDIFTLHLSIPFCLIEFSVSHPSEVEHCSPPWMLSECETGQSGRTGLFIFTFFTFSVI